MGAPRPHPVPADQPGQERLGRIFADLRAQVPLLYRTLPLQVIHGDFINRNALMQQGRITGALDFEFCARDLRALDLAIAFGRGPNAHAETLIRLARAW